MKKVFSLLIVCFVVMIVLSCMNISTKSNGMYTSSVYEYCNRVYYNDDMQNDLVCLALSASGIVISSAYLWIKK